MRWWRVFRDKLARGATGAQGPLGPRRRTSVRYRYEVKLVARCRSWPKFVELFTGDVSDGGLFVPTDERARPGEAVEVELDLPDGVRFPLSGTVVNVVTQEQAARFGKRQGLGIALDPLTGEARARFDKLLEAARRAQPVPEHVLPTGTPDPPPPPALASPPPAPASPPPVPPRRAAKPPPIPTRPAARGPIVGIDLGTTYTSVAAVVGNKVTLLPRENGARSTASVVAFERDGGYLVGPEARERIATDPAHTVVSPKRLLGRQFSDKEVQTFVDQAAYRTTEGPDGTTIVHMHGREYAIPQVCALILEDIKIVAENNLGETVEHAVVSVPISFDERRIAVLQRAGAMAGLEVVAVIDEPSAAAVANRFDPDFGGVVGVYDFGGGTFDFSVVDVSRGDFQVLATAGDTWLGGDDFDLALAAAAANQFWRQHKVHLRTQAVEWQRLVFACERAKRILSSASSAVISVPQVLRTADGMVDLELEVDRPTLARATAALIQRSLDTCDEALGLLDMRPGDLSTVYLSGGTTYVPAVREALAGHFGVPVRTGVPPEHAVCLGAAIHAAQRQYRRARTLDER